MTTQIQTILFKAPATLYLSNNRLTNLNQLKYICFLLLFLTEAKGQLAYPNDSNIVWTSGSSYPIVWNLPQVPSGDTLIFDLIISTIDNYNTSLEIGRFLNTGNCIIQIPSLFNSTKEAKIKITTKNDSLLLVSEEPFEINGYDKDLWITNEDTLVVSRDKLIPNHYFSLGFFKEISKWEVEGGYNSTQQHIYYKNPDLTLTCYENQIVFQDYLVFQTFRSGYHYFLRNNTRDFSLYDSPFTLCSSFIYSSTIKFDEFFYPTAAIRSYVPSSKLKTNQLYKAVLGDQYYFTDTILFGNYQWKDDTISVYEPLFDAMYSYTNFYVIVDSMGIIAFPIEQLYDLQLPVGTYQVFGMKAKLYEDRQQLFDINTLTGKKFRNLISYMPEEGFLVTQNLGTIEVIEDCQNTQISQANIASTWLLKEQTIRDNNTHSYNAKTSYSASSFIELEPGFNTNKGAVFEAKIEAGCEK